MFKSPFEHLETALISFIIATVLGFAAFVFTLGVDISYPQSYWTGILPLVWHFQNPADLPSVWDILLSGLLTCLCMIGRLIITAVLTCVTTYFVFLILALFIHTPKVPESKIPRLHKPAPEH